jgi:predicted small secreted protein
MKKPIRIAVLLVALVTSLFVFAACKTGSGKDKTNVDGKYYLYEDGALNKSEYFDLSDGDIAPAESA